MLFNTFIRDLPAEFDNTCDPVNLWDTNINSLLYADDLVILSESAHGLQNCLDKLEAYCLRWNLTVNLQKTKIIIFNKGGFKFKKYHFFLENTEIEITQSYCYLGIEFAASGTFNLAVSKLKDKANKALFNLKYFNTNGNVGLSFKLFNSLVLPILSYGSEVLAPFLIQNLNSDNFMHLSEKVCTEQIHNKLCRFILGLHRKSCTAAIKGELGSYPILITNLCSALKYLHHIHQCDPNSLISKCLRENYSMDQNNEYS